MKATAVSIPVGGQSGLPPWVVIGEILYRAHHYAWRAVVVPWVLVWPSFFLVVSGLLSEGAFLTEIIRQLQRPNGFFLTLWAVAAALHTATILSSQPYIGLVQRYREAQTARLGEMHRRRRFYEEWRQA